MKPNRRFRRTIASAAVVSMLGALTVGCSTASSQVREEASVADQGHTDVTQVSDLKVAYFSPANSNTFLQAASDAAQKFADEHGFQLDVFDAGFVSKTQYDQLQSALTSGRYNAFAIDTIDGNLECDILSKEAPSQGILVGILTVPICDRTLNEGEDLWTPGTTTYVGGQDLAIYRDWVEQVKADYPDGAKIALVTGPNLSGTTINMMKAAEDFSEDDGYEVVAHQATDYTTPQAFKAAQTIIQANPDVDVIMSHYSGMTRGIVEAVGGKSQVAIYDSGGDQWALDQVASGTIKSTIMALPRTEIELVLQSFIDIVEGRTPEKVIDVSRDQRFPDSSPFVYQDNVAEYTPEY